MSANFSNLRLQYKRTVSNPDVSDLVVDFNLSSLNFDINHATIGPSTPFTSELSFVAEIENTDDSTFGNLIELSNLLNGHFGGTQLDISGQAEPSYEDRIKQITSWIQGVKEVFGSPTSPNTFLLGVFSGQNPLNGTVSTENITLVFHDIDDIDSTQPATLLTNTSLQVLASVVNTGETDIFSLAWFVKIKFHADSGSLDINDSTVLFPEILLPNNPPSELSSTYNSLNQINDELRMNYELTYFPETGSAAPVASPIGKATDDLTDSLANLTSTLAANLTSTFKTQLQPAGTSFSDDTALWVLIKKGTDELSFTKYFNYMEAVFCGQGNYSLTGDLKDKAGNLDRRRSLPFMNVDAYRAVKIATEAFVMVNCMTDRRFTSQDIEDLRRSVRLVDGVPNETELSKFFNEYKVAVNGAENLIPYLAVIRRKLSNEGIKINSFEDAFDFHFGSNGSNADSCYGIISDKLTNPCFLELIWSYWHEESMMVQGLNAVCRRFQNIRGPGKLDPLANMEIDPLRPLNNLMWGYIQDHQHRLTVRRRAYEYNHHYGITLKGEAAREMRFADPRSKFIEALHTLLNLASRFYKQSDDMTVRPDGFPLLNALRETHLILSEGAHNQYGDLPSTARAEMLMEQWLLARPEFRDFLPTRIMIAYPEPWMDRVAALNQLMGFTKTSVLHFNYLAIFGEKILLSIRYGNWADPANTADAAASWAHFWRQEIQGYIHAYRAATGVDLSADGVAAGQRVDAQQPSVHLFRKLTEQQGGNGQMTKTAAKATVK